MNEESPYTPPATSPIDSPSRPKRPVFVSVICVLLMLGTALALATHDSEANRRIASWYAAYNASYVILQAVCAVGMWLMRRWAFLAFVILVAGNLAVHFAIGHWNPITIGISIVICYFLIQEMPGASQSQSRAPDE